MTMILMTTLAGATLVPGILLLSRAAVGARGRWSHSSRAARATFLLMAAGGAAWLLAHGHEDLFTGLDNMAYRKMAAVFDDGRGVFDEDRVLATAPPELRQNFLFRSGAGTRPTRDLVFQLVSRQNLATRPFFMPTLPLAAAGLPGASSDFLTPLLAACGWVLLLLTGYVAAGGAGLLAAAGLALGTAWPAWFLRGFYPDGCGSLMIAAVIASAGARPLRRIPILLCAGFTLGMAVSFHPTMLVATVPVAVILMLEDGRKRGAMALAAGVAVGVLPFWGLTRWVCQPYGDWTRWASLRSILWSTPEHTAIVMVMGCLALLCGIALVAGFRPAVRASVRRWDAMLMPWGWAVLCLLPLAVIAFLPGVAAGAALRRGALSVWSGIRLPYGVLLLVAGAIVLRPARPIRERLLLAALSWAALFYVFVQGVEIPVGLWSQRRFLPVILPLVALLCAPLAAALTDKGHRRGVRMALVALTLVAGGANLLRWPLAYGEVNEDGATEWTRQVAETIGDERLVVFDYYAHSVPYAAGLEQRVLGLGDRSRDQWPEVAQWLAQVAATGEVWVATSWSPTALEEGFWLRLEHSVTGSFPIVNTRGFFPAVRSERVVRNHFMKMVPLTEAVGPLVQDKTLDGSPVGLRGPWGAARDDGIWSRQGSGIIGPVPIGGAEVVFDAEVVWTPPVPEWREQVLLVTPPWGGGGLRCVVTAGVSHVSATWRVPDGGLTTGTGVYRLSVERPYDPSAYGLRRYDSDLGVLVRRVKIR